MVDYFSFFLKLIYSFLLKASCNASAWLKCPDDSKGIFDGCKPSLSSCLHSCLWSYPRSFPVFVISGFSHFIFGLWRCLSLLCWMDEPWRILVAFQLGSSCWGLGACLTLLSVCMLQFYSGLKMQKILPKLFPFLLEILPLANPKLPSLVKLHVWV